MDFRLHRLLKIAVVLLLYFQNIISQSTESSQQSECRMQSWERIITDSEIIESDYGVSVDYSYNETQTSFYKDDENATISAPGCPKSIDGTPWVQYGDPPRCYVPGYRGPCELHEVLVLESPNSNVATCICRTALEEDLENLERSDDGKYAFNTKDSFGVFNLDSQKCYDLGSQGPCETDQVFIRLSKSSTLKCVPVLKGTCEFNLERQTCEKVPAPVNQQPTWQSLPQPPLPPQTPARPYQPIPRNDCNDDEKFSFALKKCVKKEKGQGVGLG